MVPSSYRYTPLTRLRSRFTALFVIYNDGHVVGDYFTADASACKLQIVKADRRILVGKRCDKLIMVFAAAYRSRWFGLLLIHFIN